ncbi:MAG: LPS assembly protein LptD, partial [Nitrospirales bacterium]|nr:LPS assembly protein LptD [Nitrospirales bacterium]
LEGNFTLDARVMERLSDEQYRIEDASYTTCSTLEGETAPWRFTSEKVELDVEGFLRTRHTKFCILDVPVFYLPATLFPAKRDRATGLLFPQLGTSSQQGFKIRQAFFWDISPSQDATVALDYRGKQGTGGDLEYRYYLSKNSDGRVWTRFFKDNQLNAKRWDLIFRHRTNFPDDLQGRVDLNYVNQKDTFRALSENVIQRVAVYQESQAFLSQRWDNHVMYGLTRFSQNLTSLSDKTVLQTMPQLGYSLAPARLWGGLPVYGGLDVTFDSFHRQEGLDGSRGDMFPRLWVPIPIDRYLTVTPLVGVRETWYSRSAQSSDAVTREAVYVSTTADTRLIRRFTQEGGRAFTHKIEPSMTYEYLAPSPQADIPFFNDVDRLTRKNLLTYSLTNRLSAMIGDGETRRYVEMGYARLTQSQHVASSPTGKPWSDLRGEFIVRTAVPVSAELDVDVFYNHAQSAVSAFNTDLTVNLTKEFFFSIGQRFTHQGQVAVRGDLFNPMTLNEALFQFQKTNFYTAEVGFALPYNLYAVARGYLDQDTGQFPELNYGLYYVGSGRCWGAGIMLNQRPDQTEFAVLFTLGGVGFSDSPFSGLYRGLFQRLGLDIQRLR